jgi:hypothetical protein
MRLFVAAPFSCRLSRIILTNRGSLVLAGDENDSQGIQERIAELQRIREEYTKCYSDECWAQRSLQPKYPQFRPHVTIGRAFDRRSYALPMPWSGREFDATLSSPITLVADVPRVVHYAYRSLLRCVSQTSVVPTASADEVAYALRIVMGPHHNGSALT